MRTENNTKQRVLASIKKPESLRGGDFNPLALDVFSHQHATNPPYRNYCNQLGKNPQSIDHWSDIPTVSTDTFKFPDYPLITFPREKVSHTFLTSGTTQEVRGTHYLDSAALYNASILSAWRTLDMPPVSRVVFLTPSPGDAPSSSLSHMMGILASVLADEICWASRADGSLDIDLINRTLRADGTAAILGTALSFLHWFETTPVQHSLPKGSWALETGGYKGVQKNLEKTALYTLFRQHLGLLPDSVINEYSMTELSSQFYTRGIGDRHHAPPWTRVRVIDPATENNVPPGEPGYLCVYDLANHHSVMAIQTQDIAVAHDDQSFTLLGRDPSALPRGCSRAADHAQQS